VVFCSKGDKGAALDPRSLRQRRRDQVFGQTIVYTVHETIGHLGIFVSGGVVKKEHAEFSSSIELIDVLPHGLYEATIEARGTDTVNDKLAAG
jgi:Protein of unknown function (DUF3141)